MTRGDRTDETSDLDDALLRLVGAPPVDPEALLRRVAATRLEPGTVLDDAFVVERELGRGGMGIVFLARHEALGRNVAIKLCRRQQSERETARLMREAHAIAGLAHPNVVVVHDVGTVQDQVYVVMEHVAAGTLRTWIDAEQRPWQDVVEMFVQAGRGLQAAHAMELVHRDFKPDNVLIGDDGRARVCDFGLAAPHRSVPSGDTGGGDSVGESTVTGGTPRYMAPEQHALGPVTPAADQFSWCVALWEALSGAHPFAGADSRAVARSIVIGRRGTSTPRGVPRRIRRALERGLAPDPADRHASMEALLGQVVTPRKRIELWIGLSVVGLAVLAWAWRPVDRCATPQIQPPPWSPEDRAALAETMSSSPLRAGAELYARVETAVDAHWELWRDAERDACAAAFGDPRRLAPAHACLEVDALRMTETLRGLGTGSPDTLARALELVQAVGSPGQCIEPAKTEDSARVSGIESGAREAVVRSQTALTMGDLDAARTEAQDIVANSGDGRAVAEAELVLTKVAARRSEFDESADHGERALARAIEVGAPDISARIAAQLVYTESQRGQLGLAERWYGRARAWSTAVGDPTSLRVSAWSHWGLALRDARRFEEAQGVLREALAELRAVEGPDAGSEVPVLAHLGSTLRAMGRYDEADAILREADAITVAELGVDHPHRIVVLVSRQVLARRRGRLDEALALGREALDRVTAWIGSDNARAGEIHVNMGNVHASAGRYDQTEAEYTKALEVFERHSDISRQRMLAHNLSQLALGRDDTDTALVWARRELELLESLDQPDPTVVAYACLSHILALRGDLGAATTAIDAAIERMDAAYGADDPQRAIPLLAQGRLQLERDEPEAALATLTRATDLLERNEHGKSHPTYEHVELYRGIALVRLGRFAAALPVARALVDHPVSPDFDAGALQRLLAEARAGTGDHDGALEALDEGLSLFREAGDEIELAEATQLRQRWLRGDWPGR